MLRLLVQRLGCLSDVHAAFCNRHALPGVRLGLGVIQIGLQSLDLGVVQERVTQL